MDEITADFILFGTVYLLVCLTAIYWPDIRYAFEQLAKYVRGEF